MMNSTPDTLYRQHRRIGWTRADMLVALYTATISQVDALLEALEDRDEKQEQYHRLKASRLVLEIFAGLDLQQGELPQRLAQLCEYMQYCLTTSDPDRLASARRILSSLREAYESIREDAVALEAEGKITRFDQDAMGLALRT